MERILTYICGEEEDGFRLSRFLRRRGYSLPCLKHLKEKPERVLLEGSPRFLTERIHRGEQLRVCFQEEESSEKLLPVDLPLSILYEDEDILVVNKPAGMPTHPSMKNYDNTLANALAFYFAERGEAFVFRCCNRLDRDTSGLTVVAKNMLAGAILSKLTAERQIHREYRAIVRGHVEPSEGIIDAPLGRKPGSVIERVVDYEKGEPAVTHYRVEMETETHSLVALLLETGRTHQIRIHMKHLGYPIIGDYLYNPDMEDIKRQALHAYRLSFPHPVQGKIMDFVCELPQDMDNVMKNLKKS